MTDEQIRTLHEQAQAESSEASRRAKADADAFWTRKADELAECNSDVAYRTGTPRQVEFRSLPTLLDSRFPAKNLQRSASRGNLWVFACSRILSERLKNCVAFPVNVMATRALRRQVTSCWMVGGARFELATNGLKVIQMPIYRYPAPSNYKFSTVGN